MEHSPRARSGIRLSLGTLLIAVGVAGVVAEQFTDSLVAAAPPGSVQMAMTIGQFVTQPVVSVFTAAVLVVAGLVMLDLTQVAGLPSGERRNRR